MKKSANKDKIAVCLAMAIFGTVGIFSKLMPFSSGIIAFVRSVVGFLFLAALMLMLGRKPNFALIKKHLIPLLISGVLLGANWALFFEACKLTTVSSATLAYYLEPVILTVIGAVFFKEKIGIKRAVCIAVAIFGMALVSGIFGSSEGVNIVGILLGLMAAFLYAVIVALNKTLGDISVFDKTAFQFAVSAVVLVPYIAFTGGFSFEGAEPISFVMLAVVGIVHTGIVYALYFGATPRLEAGEIAIMSYIDPIVALLVSALLGEGLSGFGILGAVLIIASSAVADIPFGKKAECENENR